MISIIKTLSNQQSRFCSPGWSTHSLRSASMARQSSLFKMEQIRGNQEGGNELNTTAMWLSASVARKYWIKKKEFKAQWKQKMQRTIITRHTSVLEELNTPHMQFFSLFLSGGFIKVLLKAFMTKMMMMIHNHLARSTSGECHKIKCHAWTHVLPSTRRKPGINGADKRLSYHLDRHSGHRD